MDRGSNTRLSRDTGFHIVSQSQANPLDVASKICMVTSIATFSRDAGYAIGGTNEAERMLGGCHA